MPHLLIHNCPPLSRKRGDIKSHLSVCPSVCPSVCHKNFNLGHTFCTITDRAMILGMCVPCDKTFLEVPCRDLDGDLWPTSRSNLLPSGGPQFSEFVCFLFNFYEIFWVRIWYPYIYCVHLQVSGMMSDLAWLWPWMNLNYKVSILLISEFVNHAWHCKMTELVVKVFQICQPCMTLPDGQIGSESVLNMSAMHDIARWPNR